MNVIDSETGRILGRIVPTLQERILATIDVTSDGCWMWLGDINPAGYGQLRVENRTRKAHRIAYREWKGPIPEGMTLDHYRRNPGPREAPCSTACVNPDHLEPATMTENILRGNTTSGRCARQTHCKRGHPFDAEHMKISKRGKRVCEPCRKHDRAEYRQRTGK